MSRSESQEPCAEPVPPQCVVLVNGQEKAVPANCSVVRLLWLLDLSGGRIAVAVTRSAVPRSRYAGVELAAGERVGSREAGGGGCRCPIRVR